MDRISELEFNKLLDGIYQDRQRIYSQLPGFSHRDAILWMLLGSLVALLSVPLEEQPKLDGQSNDDPYGDAIRELVRERGERGFDPNAYFADLSERLQADD